MDPWAPAIVSIIVSGLIAYFVAHYIRFNTKPAHERVFDENRNANLTRIFDQLSTFDDEVGRFFETLTNNFGELSRDRTELYREPFDVEWELDEEGEPFPKQVSVEVTEEDNQRRMILEFPEHDFHERLGRLKEQQKLFLRDYNIYLNYIHDSFLRDIRDYYYNTIEYFDSILHNIVSSFRLIRRNDCATRTIQYLEEDNSIQKTTNMLDFIQRWKEYMPQTN